MRTNVFRSQLLALAVLATSVPGSVRSVSAQTAADRDGVKRAAMDYIEGFYEGDTAKLVRSITPQVFKYGFDRPTDRQKYTGEVMTWAEILGYARDFKAKGRKTPATAAREVTVLDVQDQTAAAKVTAWWGTDYLLLGKFDGRWKISHVLWQSPPPKAR